MSIRLSICLLVLLSIVPNCYANENSWSLKRDAAGIRINQQATPSGYPLTRGEVVISVDPTVLIAAMADRKNCSRWVYACKQGWVVSQYNQTQRLDYTFIDSPLWFADRDMYIYSEASLNRPSKTITIRLSGRENHDKVVPGRVRIRNFYGLWHLRQTAENTSSVTYQVHGNPQLPASALLDGYMVESVFQTLDKLRQVARDPAYKKAAIPVNW